MNHNKNISGFTLIEMSIVLVIIGLIVGGILAGRDLIYSATIRSQVSQFAQFDQAKNTFITKYSGLPADLTYPLTGSCSSGNGNGIIGTVRGTASNGEPAKYFSCLSDMGLISYKYNIVGNCYNYGDFPGSIFPETKFKGSGIAVISMDDGYLYYYLGPTLVEDTSSGCPDNPYFWMSNSPTPAVSPNNAQALDTKIDDGVPSTGKIRAVVLTGLAATNFGNDATLNSCLGATNQVYNSSNLYLCRLLVKSN